MSKLSESKLVGKQEFSPGYPVQLITIYTYDSMYISIISSIFLFLFFTIISIKLLQDQSIWLYSLLFPLLLLLLKPILLQPQKPHTPILFTVCQWHSESVSWRTITICHHDQTTLNLKQKTCFILKTINIGRLYQLPKMQTVVKEFTTAQFLCAVRQLPFSWFNLSARWRLVVNVTPQLLYSWKETQYPSSVNPIIQHLSFPGIVKHHCSSKTGFHCTPISKNSIPLFRWNLKFKT